jgi:hypothetical protein
MIGSPEIWKNNLMFMIVTYPWPVASAQVAMAGHLPDAAATTSDAIHDTVEHRARHLEETVRWTHHERLRFRWYQFRIAIRAIRRAALRG